MAPRTQSTSNSPPPRDTASHMPPGGVPLKLQDALSYFYMVKTKSHDNPKVYDRFLNIIKDFKNQRIGMPSVIEHVSVLFSGCGELMQGFNIFLPQGYQIEPMADKCNQDFVTLTTPSGAATQTSSVPPGHCLPESPPPRRGRASAATPVHKGLHLLMPDPDPAPEFDNCVFFHSSPASNVLESSLGRIQAEDHYAMRNTIPRSIQATASCDKIKQRFASHPDAYEKLLEILPNHRKEERPTTEPSHQDSPLWDFIEIMYSNPVCDFGDDALFGMVTQILNSDTESSGVDAREGLRKKRSRGSTPASEGEESPGKLARQGVKEDGRRGTHRKDGEEWGPWEAILRQSKQGREEGYEMKNEGREDNGPYGEVAHDDQVVRSSYLGGPPLPTCAHGDTIVRSLYPNTPPTPSLADTHIRVVTHDFAHHHRSIGRTRTKEAPCKDIFQALVNHGMKDISSEIILQSAKLTEGSGFGDVWSGRLRDSTQIALKVWRAPSVWYSDSQSMKRVARELYTWSKIEHDNVQELLGVTMLHGRLGIVSPWMGQGNLREYIHRHPEVNRYQLCIQVATGLSYLHSQSIVHGDLKAANVLVSCDGIAKLNNFDHAIMSEFSHVFSETSYSRANGGTARWMAPELMLGSSGGRNPQADVYALGMTILEILTGHPPYYPQYKFDAQVVLAVTKQKHPDRPMDCLGDNAQGNQMWNMLVSCWSHEPSARPKSAGVAEIVRSIESNVKQNSASTRDWK